MDHGARSCSCKEKISYQENWDDLDKIFKQKQIVGDQFDKIIIISNSEEFELGFNNIKIWITEGITHICLCKLRSLPFPIAISLFSDALNKLVPMACGLVGTCAYMVAPQGHKPGCGAHRVMSLKFWSHVSLHLKGYHNHSLEEFINRKLAPPSILDSKPNVQGLNIRCDLTNLVHYEPIFQPYRDDSCNNKYSHLGNPDIIWPIFSL